MQDKIQSLRRTLEQDPPDGKLLQMQLQGGIATAVNQVHISAINFIMFHHKVFFILGSFPYSTTFPEYSQIRTHPLTSQA